MISPCPLATGTALNTRARSDDSIGSFYFSSGFCHDTRPSGPLALWPSGPLGLWAANAAGTAAATFGLFSSGDNGGCRQGDHQSDCQQYHCVEHLRKDNIFKRSMHSLMGHLPSLKGCDEICCDKVCDALMLEALIEMREAFESASISPNESYSLRNTNQR